MPLLRKPVLQPIEGIDYSRPSTMINDRAGFPQNIELYRNELKKRSGNENFSSTAISDATACMHIAQYNLKSLLVRLIRFSNAKAEKYNTTTGVWGDITGSDFSGDDDDLFHTVVAEDKLIIANGFADAIRTYNDAGNTANLTAADGTIPKAKAMEYFGGYLVCGNIEDDGTAYPTKVKWSEIGDITTWGSGNASSSLLYHDPLPIRAMKNLNEYLAVYKKNSIYLGRKVLTSEIIAFDLIETGTGIISLRAIAEANGKHYFMTPTDFRVFSGAPSTSIADKLVQREIFARINDERSNRNFAVHMPMYDEIWFFIVTAGYNWPREIWKYNYKMGWWYFDTCLNVTAANTYYLSSDLTWDDLTGTWDTLSVASWDDFAQTTDTEVIILGDSNGMTYKLNNLLHNDHGNAIEAEWQSIDFVADKFENYKRWLKLDFEAKGDSVKVYYSTDYGTTWTLIKNQTLTPTWVQYRVYFDVVAKNIRFKFLNYESGETFYLRHFYPYYLVREEYGR